MKKVITFVPQDILNDIIDAMSKAGAGNMNNYSHTCFITEGMGNWFSKDGSNPDIGAVGQMSREKEFKIEMLCPEENIIQVIEAIKAVHTYETPEIDVIEIDLYTK
jgi:hypothetical protein